MDERDRPDQARWWEFEQFGGRDPDADAGISVSATEHDEAFAGIGSRDEGFVMVGQRDGRPLLVTVKSKTPQNKVAPG